MMKFDYSKYEYNLAFLCAAKDFQGAAAIRSNSNRPLPNDSRQGLRPPQLKLVASNMRASEVVVEELWVEAVLFGQIRQKCVRSLYSNSKQQLSRGHAGAYTKVLLLL